MPATAWTLVSGGAGVIRSHLVGFNPSVRLDDGIRTLADSVIAQNCEHRSDAAFVELQLHGLVR